jgi:hypothetical protein
MPIGVYVHHHIDHLVKTIAGRIAKRPIAIVTRIISFSWNSNKKGGNGYQIEKYGSPEVTVTCVPEYLMTASAP